MIAPPGAILLPPPFLPPPVLEPEPAPDTELHRAHVPSYLEAVRLAPMKGDDPAHGLGTDTSRSGHAVPCTSQS